MSERDLTYQQRDPVGSYSVRPVTLVMSASTIVVAVLATITSWPVETNPFAAWLAVIVTVLSAVGLSYWSNPLRAPFGTTSVFLVFFLATSAVIIAPIGTWGSSALIVHQWAPITAGLTIAQLSPYRPARELIAVTVLTTITAAFVTVIHPAVGVGSPIPLVAIVNSALPIAALGLGGSSYATSLARSHGRWYSRPSTQDRIVSPAMRDRVARSVYEDRVSILNNTVVPFFSEVLERGSISHGDRDRARVISAEIRTAMVADVDRSWLDAVVDHLADERNDVTLPGSEVVLDTDRLASGMSTEQRIVTRALILALFDHPGFDPDGFAILIAFDAGAAVMTLTAKLDEDESITRSTLAPYFAVVRIAFSDLHVDFHAPTLTLKFSYDHR